MPQRQGQIDPLDPPPRECRRNVRWAVNFDAIDDSLDTKLKMKDNSGSKLKLYWPGNRGTAEGMLWVGSPSNDHLSHRVNGQVPDKINKK